MISRRIERNAAEERRLTRILDGAWSSFHGRIVREAPGDHRDRLEVMRDELRADVEYDRARVAELTAGKPVIDRSTVSVGDAVTIRGSDYRVTKANPKTVQIKTFGLTLTYPYSEIQRHTKAEG